MTDLPEKTDVAGTLARLQQAKAQLASITDLPEAKDFRDKAQALLAYAKAAGASFEIQNECAELGLKAEGRAGELLKELQLGPGNPQWFPSVTIGEKPRLRDFGITKKQSFQWQRIASIPPDVLEQFLSDRKREKQEITRTAALGLYREVSKVKKRSAAKARVDAAEVMADARIIHGRMEDELERMEPASVHLILTDPPYGLGETANIQFETREAISAPRGEWDMLAEYEMWIAHFMRLMRADGSLYIFVPDSGIGPAWSALSGHGFKVRNLLTWEKTNPPPSVRQRSFPSSCEYILFATVSERYTFNWLGHREMQSCIRHPICQGRERLDHPTQKPVGLLKKLIRISSNEGDLVLDPFAGVGSTGAAARELGRDYILVEEDEYYYRQACIRLQG